MFVIPYMTNSYILCPTVAVIWALLDVIMQKSHVRMRSHTTDRHTRKNQLYFILFLYTAWRNSCSDICRLFLTGYSLTLNVVCLTLSDKHYYISLYTEKAKGWATWNSRLLHREDKYFAVFYRICTGCKGPPSFLFCSGRFLTAGWSGQNGSWLPTTI